MSATEVPATSAPGALDPSPHNLPHRTHEVHNQAPPLEDFDAFGTVRSSRGCAARAAGSPRTAPTRWAVWRLGEEPGAAFGTLPAGQNLEAIVERHRPRL